MATALQEVGIHPCWRERKKMHESSEHIYPKCEKSYGLNIPRKQNIGSFGTTSYSVDFAKKEGKPALPRPCSVTRRNRPHPSQNFLNWRIPSKPMPGQKTNDASKAFLYLSAVETRERFYDDYVGRFNTEKGKLYQDVGCLIPRYPTRPRVIQRADFEGKSKDEKVSSSVPRTNDDFIVKGGIESIVEARPFLTRTHSIIFKTCVMPPLCVSKDAGQKYDNLVAKTSPKERVMVENCLDAGDRGYLGKSLASAIRPEAIPAIHQWLKNQNGADRDVVVGFLSNLGKKTDLNQDLETDRKHCRLQPLCIDKNTSAEISKAACDAILDQVRQMLSNDVGSTERRRPTKCPPLKKSKKGSRFPMCPPRGFVINKGALFMQPHRCLPRHFEIHPEFHEIISK